ncbi:uncharacterized protein TNCV_1522961 [Trichonephila clavipes]|nr:uncharacterized protein TNCV_1522961 [Trichonephila clavipes]
MENNVMYISNLIDLLRSNKYENQIIGDVMKCLVVVQRGLENQSVGECRVMEVTRVEQCSYIKIAVLRGKNAMECHSELVEALGNNALPYRTVARWIGKLQQGCVSTSDE